MVKKLERPLQKHSIRLFEGQFDTLQEMHPELGATHVIRLLIDAHIARVREKEKGAGKNV